jgi:hypothetical protein
LLPYASHMFATQCLLLHWTQLSLTNPALSLTCMCVSRTLQLVIEDLRYVDTAVVLAFVKARADSVIRDPNHYSAHLG